LSLDLRGRERRSPSKSEREPGTVSYAESLPKHSDTVQLTPLVFRDEREQGKQDEEKPAQEVNEQERARAFETREEDVFVVDEAPVEGEAEGNRQAQLVPRKKETEGQQRDEQRHVGDRDRQLHLV